MKSIFKKIFITLIIITTILNTVFVIIAINLWNNVEINDLSKLYPKNSTLIYDNNNNLIANLSSVYTKHSNFEEIPQVLIDAFISVEDSRFFTHNGVDLEAVIRSIVVNLKGKDYIQGASTITQQLVKNIYLSNEKSLERKINEVILALKLEKLLSKEDIIACYLSNVLFGGRIYGVKMAAKYYFDKELYELQLKEAALLAGIIQMPNYYNPFINHDETTNRRNIVLKRMLEENYIDTTTYNDTISIDIDTYLKKGEINNNLGIYSSYIDYLYQESKEVYGIDLYKEDLKMTINVNSEIQSYIHDITKNKYNTFPDDYLKVGIVVLDNATGHILAISGTRENGLRNLNYATEVYNQPASTIKPILSYAPAIEYLNYVPLTQILDEPYKYSNGMTVKNWDNRYLGNISLRYALSNSRNIPAIKLYNQLGKDKAWEFANNVGIYNKDSSFNESMPIGGFKNGYSVLEMTNSYIAFPNQGKFIKAYAINQIEQKDEIIQNQNTFQQAFTEETAYLITNILHDVLKNTSYDLKEQYLSSKTGQSNYDYETRVKYGININATKDSWAIGYTPDLTVGVWCGYDNIKNGYYLTPKNKDIPIKIMSMILKEFATKNLGYKLPKNLKLMDVEIINGLIYEAGDKNIKRDYFHKGFTPLLRENLDNIKV